MTVHQKFVHLETPDAKHPEVRDSVARAPGIPVAPHREPAELVVSALDSDAAHGLARAEAQRRLEQYGPNRLKSAPETPWWKRLLEQFENFLVIILLVATVISVVEWLLQDPRESALPYEAIVIMAIVILNALLGFIQEARAEKSVRALMALAAPEATVIRDGERQRVATDDIVPGDIVLVEAGDKIPADARIVEAANLQTDEAPLTGESMPVPKEVEPVEGDCRPRRPPQHAVLGHGRHLRPRPRRGRRDRHGDRGRPHRRAAGSRREGADAAAAGTRPHRQAAQRRSCSGSARWCSPPGCSAPRRFTLNVVLSLFLFAVALAVAAIPEALPAIVTVGLSLGVRRMAAANAIVRKLPAVETLGAATVICSDKTGTLTRNEMTVRAIVTADALIEVGGSGYIPEGDFTIDGQGARRNVVAARRASSGRCAPQRSPTTRRSATARAAGACRATRPKARWSWRRASSASPKRSWRGFRASPKSRSPPSASATPPSISTARQPGELHVFVKGAPELLLGKCRYVVGERSGRSADRRGTRRALLQRNEALAGQALRTLAIATRTVPAAALGVDPQTAAGRAAEIELPESIEDDLVLLGLVGMIDPPRDEAKAAVDHRQARAHPHRDDHRRPSGDRRCDRPRARHLRAGSAARHRRRAARAWAMPSSTPSSRRCACSRASIPSTSCASSRALQRKGHIVAMTGDGINDAPALKTANIGVAMGITGTDVSKEAADMVLTDDNFASIVKAIEEGRGDLRQHPEVSDLSAVDQLRRVADDVRGRDVCGRARPRLGGARAVPAAARRAAALDQPDHRRSARARARRRSQGPRRHEAAAAAARLRRAVDRGLDPPRLRRLADDGRNARRARRLLSGRTVHAVRTGTGPNVADEAHARTMAFTTLMMFQLFDVYNCRSRRRSAFSGLLREQVAARRDRVLARHAHPGDLRAGAADGVPYGAAVDARLAGRDCCLVDSCSSPWSSPRSCSGSCVRTHMPCPPRRVRPGYSPKPRRDSSRPAGAVRHRRQSRPRTPD